MTDYAWTLKSGGVCEGQPGYGASRGGHDSPVRHVIERRFGMRESGDQLLTHYAWTIEASGLKRIQKVTTLPELHDILQMLKLPGIAPPTWLTMDPWREALPGDGRYIYDEGGSNEWSVVWTKVNYGPGDVK